MIIMPSANSSPIIHYWAGKYPGKIGWLFGPTWAKQSVRKWIPYALDNDRFAAFSSGKEWNESDYFRFLDSITKVSHGPLWLLVPDVVADKLKTLESWYHYYPKLKQYGWPMAFAVQDGMIPTDVPSDADVVFVGGTTQWKWRNAKWFCDNFSRVHIGRVNTIDRLWICKDYGAESVDGTGWFRRGDNDSTIAILEEFLDGKREPELELEYALED